MTEFEVCIDMKLRKELLDLVTVEHTHPKGLTPISVSDVKESSFFSWYCNHYCGFFFVANYHDGFKEIWFAVNLEAGCVDEDWHIERVLTC